MSVIRKFTGQTLKKFGNRGSWRLDRRNRDRKSFVNVCFIINLIYIFFFSLLHRWFRILSFPSILLFFRRTLISTPYFRSFLSFHRCHSFPRFESFPTVQLLTETLYIVCESDRSIKNTRIKREQNPPRLEKRIYMYKCLRWGLWR